MTVHVVSETEFVTKGQGVHTAFVDHIELLREKNDVDVVVNAEGDGEIFHSHTYGPYFFWKGRHYKGKRVYTVHVIPDSIKGSLPMWKYWLPFVKWYFKQVYSYADVCIAISPMVEKAIKELGSETEIVKISNPIPVERWKRTEENRKKGREMFGLGKDDFVVLGVGQLQGRKGVEDFLEIAEAIPDARFVWAGGRPFGPMTEGIKRLNDKITKASTHIHFTGLLDLKDMPYIYAAGDVFIFPSYQENCPLAPLEAAASGMPVVFRDLEEYELLYENPYLKAMDTQEFIKIVRKLKDDDGFYKKGLEISEKLITQFDREEIRKKLITLYYNLIKKT
jgi:1,2-diacylglycerol-3-alpha-glucose alpha-1,2-galactosyltransferase